MNALKTIVLSFMFSVTLLAQSGWYDVFEGRTCYSVYFPNENTGFVSALKFLNNNYYPIIIKTTNAGNSWNELNVPHTDSASILYRSIFFTDANTGYAAAMHLSNPNFGRILKTTNGGISWVILPLPVNKQMSHLFFVNSTTGYASGWGTMLKTTNGGSSWEYQYPGSEDVYNELHFIDANTGYVSCHFGKIIKTTNGGANWNLLNTGTSLHLWGLTFTDANTGFAVGGNLNGTEKIILRTTDAGSSWTPSVSSGCQFWSVRFANQNTGWITGLCGQILKTTNGGLNWGSQSTPLLFNVQPFIINATTGYIAGYGMILKTTDGGGIFTGIEPINSNVPSEFKLFQNYPNPFNPSTKIAFDLPKAGKVKLAVYDLLGKEITTLVNEELNPGAYELSWNASDYPSGVYFYSLITNGFTGTRKMILTK